MFNAWCPAFVQWNILFGHADVPGSSLPSAQSQYSSFTCANGIVSVLSKHVKSFAGSYSPARDKDTPRGRGTSVLAMFNIRTATITCRINSFVGRGLFIVNLRICGGNEVWFRPVYWLRSDENLHVNVLATDCDWRDRGVLSEVMIRKISRISMFTTPIGMENELYHVRFVSFEWF